MSVGLAIFVKTPGLSPIKTRLAASTGEGYALAFYRHALASVVAVAREAQARQAQLLPYFAVAEAALAATSIWRALPALAQGEGGLGERMARVHDELVARHGAAILIGADAPQLTPELLAQAADWLAQDTPRIVFGPARDGGFWLVGANRRLPLAGWTGVHYSRDDTAQAFRARMHAHGEWLELPMLADLDLAQDADTVRRELQALPAPLAPQRALLHWLCADPGARAGA